MERECPVCGKLYEADPVRLKHGRQTTCSRRCSYQLRATENTSRIDLTCSVCGKKFTRCPSHHRSKHGGDFCSRKCHYEGRSLGLVKRVVLEPYTVTDAGRAAWKEGAKKTVVTRRRGDNYVHSDATRAKISEGVARHLARTQSVFATSKIEDVTARELDTLGVTYERQFIFRDPRGRFTAVVDFWLPTLSRVLEVNGTFWHADPRVYPGALLPIQERAVAKYRRKLELLRTLNVVVCEVWEGDLKKEPRQAVLSAYTKGSSC